MLKHYSSDTQDLRNYIIYSGYGALRYRHTPYWFPS